MLNNEGFVEECEILGGREGNFVISMINKKKLKVRGCLMTIPMEMTLTNKLRE